VLVIGTGASGLMKVLPEVELSPEVQGIKLVARPTSEACSIYNQLPFQEGSGRPPPHLLN